MRAIIFLAALFGTSVQAQTCTTVKVHFAFDINSYAYIHSYTELSNEEFAQTQVDKINSVLANSGVTWRAQLAGVSQSLPSGYTSITDLLMPSATSSAVALSRDDAGADVVMGITQFDGDALNGRAVMGPSMYGTAIVNARAAENGLTAVHEFMHMIGVSHQRETPETPANPAASNAHGWVSKTGTDAATCLIQYTVEASVYDKTMPGAACAGVDIWWQPGQPMGTASTHYQGHTCDIQAWCEGYVDYYTRYYPPATPATAWGVLMPAGNQTYCSARDSHFYPLSSPPYVYGGGGYVPDKHSGPGPSFTCNNVVQVPYLSAPGRVINGIAMGDASNNGTAAAQSACPAVAQLRNTSKVQWLAGNVPTPIVGN